MQLNRYAKLFVGARWQGQGTGANISLTSEGGRGHHLHYSIDVADYLKNLLKSLAPHFPEQSPWTLDNVSLQRETRKHIRANSYYGNAQSVVSL